MKKLVNQFLKTFRKKSFEEAVIKIICFQIKKGFSNINEKKTLLPVIYASVSGITITMATKKLKRKGYEIYSNKKILDTIGNFNHKIIEEFAMQTRKVIFKIAKRFGFCKRKTIVSIDFHDKPFYGNKNISEVVGTKRKLGTNFAYSYITVCICEEGIRFNLATIPVTRMKLKKNLVNQLIDEARKYVSIGLVLLDRGFNGVDISRVLDAKIVKYVMPLIKNKKIKKICDIPSKLGVMKYIYYEGRSKEYQEEIRVIIDKRNKEKHYFTTNIKGNKKEILSAIILAYRRRWGIETGYRVADDFYAWTTSVNFNTRTFLVLFSFLMQDLWILYNFIDRQGTKFQQPRSKILKGCRKITLFIKRSIQELNFYWRPFLEAELFKEDISDCVKKILA